MRLLTTIAITILAECQTFNGNKAEDIDDKLQKNLYRGSVSVIDSGRVV